jgi:hypothetical protein
MRKPIVILLSLDFLLSLAYKCYDRTMTFQNVNLFLSSSYIDVFVTLKHYNGHMVFFQLDTVTQCSRVSLCSSVHYLRHKRASECNHKVS